eukprot:m.355366 g.355366  ORF g.355366 m.355366 type:complete len:235 (+) comp17236_c0_seq1:85-789(+)
MDASKSLDELIPVQRSQRRGGSRGGRGGRGRGGRNGRGGRRPKNDSWADSRPRPVAYDYVAPQPQPSGKLLVENLDYGVSQDDLQELFGGFGELKYCRLHFDNAGRSLGTGEVLYRDPNCAATAMREYNGVDLDGRPMRISVVQDRRAPPPQRMQRAPRQVRAPAQQKPREPRKKQQRKPKQQQQPATQEELDAMLTAYSGQTADDLDSQLDTWKAEESEDVVDAADEDVVDQA